MDKDEQKPVMKLKEIGHYFPIGSKYLDGISIIFIENQASF